MKTSHWWTKLQGTNDLITLCFSAVHNVWVPPSFFCHTEMVAWLVLAMLLPCKLLTSNFSLLLLTVAFSRHKLITLLCIYKVFSAVCTMRCIVNVCFHKRLYLYITSSLCSPFYVVQMVASCDHGLNNLLQLWEHISEQQRTKIRQTSKPHYSLMIHRHAKQGPVQRSTPIILVHPYRE